MAAAESKPGPGAAAGEDYQLRCELRGHADDVRAVCTFGKDGIITASRDKNLCLWSPAASDGGRGYSVAVTLVGHTSFAGAVAEAPQGRVVSGSMDARVLLWDAQSGALLQDLRGHELQVTGVAITASGDVASSSVDKTVRVWRDGSCINVLHGHESSVLAVLALPSGELVSGSGDCTVKVWRGSSCIQTLRGHQDSVRGLALMPGIGILSASHDGSVRLWAQSGELLLEMVGHKALVYCVAAGAAGEVASGSEDNTARIWQDGQCKQTIDHPGCIWAVTYLPGGDLVTACSDGVARVWTRDASKRAPPDQIAAYEAQLATRSGKTVGGVKVEDLPGPEALKEPGKKDGQIKIFREGGSGVAFSWNAKEYQWDKIGEVVDGPEDGSQGKELDGVTYDFVFDVDIGDGVPHRKLPYNRSENPYTVADRWLVEQDLPMGYREQVVQFIISNSGGPSPSLDNTVANPYTGGNAYVPSSRQPTSSFGSTPMVTNPDPYTGNQSTHQPAPASSNQNASLLHIPKRGYLAFDTAQYDGILKKMLDFNATIAASDDVSIRTSAMANSDLLRLQAMLDVLRESSQSQSSTFADVDFTLLIKVLLSWPPTNLFPGNNRAHWVATAILAGFLPQIFQRASSPPALPANLLTAIRAAVNCFKQEPLRLWMGKHASEILDLFADCMNSANKNIRLAISTLILNSSLLALEIQDSSLKVQTLSAAMEMSASSDDDSESLFRALVALGTLIHGGDVKDVALDLGVGDVVKAQEKSETDKIAQVAKEIAFLLK
eukprot:SM000126S26307  [mRNA]  locus=s126:117967:124577:+ [translate_table: standard]